VRKNLTAYGNDPGNWMVVPSFLNTSLFDPPPTDGWVQPPFARLLQPLPALTIPKTVVAVPNTDDVTPAIIRNNTVSSVMPFLIAFMVVFVVLAISGIIFSFNYVLTHQKAKDSGEPKNDD